MNIDPAAEDLGRIAIRWVGAGKKDEFLDAVAQIADAEPELRDQVIPIYIAVTTMAMRAIYRGGAPNQPQNQELAEEILEKLPWGIVELHDVYEFLEDVTAPDRQPQITDPRRALAVLIIAGYLISWYHRGLGYTNPYTFLDDLLNTLATAP